MSNVLFIKKGTKLKTSNNSVVVECEDENKDIPVSEISVVVIESLQCSITAAVNVLCNSNCIPIIYCDSKHSPVAVSSSFNTYHKQLSRINQQLSWTDSRKQKLYTKIIIQKIENQVELLKYLNVESTSIRTIEDKLEGISKTNCIEVEAVVAKLYFNQLFGDEFIRFKDDEVNAALNYGYAILRGVIKQYIVAKGLIPALGLWHKSQYNNYNLADDVIEVFRPIVDFVVYHLIIKDDDFTKEERIYLQNTIFQKVRYNNKTFEYGECLNLFLDQILKYMNRDTNEVQLPKLDCRLYEY